MNVAPQDVRELGLQPLSKKVVNDYADGRRGKPQHLYVVWAKVKGSSMFKRFTVATDKHRLLGRNAIAAFRLPIVTR